MIGIVKDKHYKISLDNLTSNQTVGFVQVRSHNDFRLLSASRKGLYDVRIDRAKMQGKIRVCYSRRDIPDKIVTFDKFNNFDLTFPDYF